MNTDKIINYLKENEDIFNQTIEELDAWNGYLGDDRWYPMYELSELLSGKDIVDVLQMAYYGNFNPNDEYFRFNGYGNLESSDYLDYSDHLDKYFIEELVENQNHINFPSIPLSYMVAELVDN